jgi:1,4-alpha-glucan branching enzyme
MRPTSFDIHLFHEGNLSYAHRSFGAHLTREEGVDGCRFTLWAPRAQGVQVVGVFNRWDESAAPMTRIGDTGVWSTFIPAVREGDAYKYRIIGVHGQIIYKADPYGFFAEVKPQTASKVYRLEGYEWGDSEWLKRRQARDIYRDPQLIYEAHLGSWKKKDNGDYMTYRELAHEMVDYVADMGYTHIELMPISEHPFDGSWGYQVTGFFAATSRYGAPKDFMYFVDRCHQMGLGVLLDWVPAHFCKDEQGLYQLDGAPLYEIEEFPGWGTMKFDFGCPQVQSFLISNACFWFDVYHVDGLRADAVSSMLYLDYGKEASTRRNRYGGDGDLEAVEFLKKLNYVVFREFPWAQMVAEEATDWPLVTGPVHMGGLGFNFKWNMGWMNDVLRYMALDAVYRPFHLNLLTFSLMYAFSENFILPLSHDEVVHGKKSLLDKMSGDYWRKFAGLRTLIAYMFAHPGKKLIFMGTELAPFMEWRYYESLEWHLLGFDAHRQFKHYMRVINYFYLNEPALWEQDRGWEGFSWIDCHNEAQSIISFVRWGKQPDDFMVVLCNFTPAYYGIFRLGVPRPGYYRQVFNSDESEYGGSGKGMSNRVWTRRIPLHGQAWSIEIEAPPLSCIMFKRNKRVHKRGGQLCIRTKRN